MQAHLSQRHVSQDPSVFPRLYMVESQHQRAQLSRGGSEGKMGEAAREEDRHDVKPGWNGNGTTRGRRKTSGEGVRGQKLERTRGEIQSFNNMTPPPEFYRDISTQYVFILSSGLKQLKSTADIHLEDQLYHFLGEKTVCVRARPPQVGQHPTRKSAMFPDPDNYCGIIAPYLLMSLLISRSCTIRFRRVQRWHPKTHSLLAVCLCVLTRRSPSLSCNSDLIWY